jgi:hypothetical protein
MSNLIINLLLFMCSSFMFSVYHRFPSLSGRTQISRRRSPHPPIPCLPTALRPPSARRPHRAACRRTGLRSPPVELASSPSRSPMSSPSLARPRHSAPGPPSPCPDAARPRAILPVATSWSTRWPRLLSSPSACVKHSRKPSGGGSTTACAVKKVVAKEEEAVRAAPQHKVFFLHPFPSLASVADHLLF